MNWPFLTIDRPAGLGGGGQQVGLPGEEGRDLQQIADLGRRGGLRRLVNVGHHRQARRFLDPPTGFRAPLPSPGPRYDSTLVRFALSNDALKINRIGSPSAISLSRVAIASDELARLR